MYFAAQKVSDNKSTKLAVVLVFHVILGICLVNSMGVKLLPRLAEAPPFVLLPAPRLPVPPPPTAAVPQPPQLPAPRVFVPVVEVPPTTTPPATVTTTTTTSEPVPPAQATNTASTPPAIAGAGTAKVRTAAMLDGCAKPEYPKQAARNGDAGIVTLALLVGVDGRVSGARVDRSSGFRDLDKAALTALSLCTFKPAMQGDVAQAGWTQIAYEWKLD